MPKVKDKSLKLNMMLNAIKGLMSVIFPLISFPYISRVLGVDNIGRYNFANSIVSYFVLIAALGISTYSIRNGARLREDEVLFRKFANEMFSINLFSTVVAYVSLLLLILGIPKFQEYESLLIILSLSIIFQTVGTEWIFSIFEDYAYITLRSVIFQVVSLILLFTFVKNESDINIYAAITVLSSAGSNILNYAYARKYCRVKFTSDIDWKTHMKPIMVLFAMAMTVTIYVSSDITILGFLSDNYTVGIYAISTKIYTILKMLLSSILVVSIPRLSAMLGNKDREAFNTVASDIYRTLLTLVTPAIVGIIIFRKQIVLLISDESYISATSSLSILSIALFFCLGAWFWGQCILVPLKKEIIVLRVTVVSALVNVVLNFLLIPQCQENAAAFTTVVAEGIAFVWCMYEGRKHTELVGIGKTFIKVSLGCLSILGTVQVISLFKMGEVGNTIVSMLASVVIYFTIEIFLKNEAMLSLVEGIKNKLKMKKQRQ